MDLATLGETVGLVRGLSTFFIAVAVLGSLFALVSWLIPRG